MDKINTSSIPPTYSTPPHQAPEGKVWEIGEKTGQWNLVDKKPGPNQGQEKGQFDNRSVVSTGLPPTTTTTTTTSSSSTSLSVRSSETLAPHMVHVPVVEDPVSHISGNGAVQGSAMTLASLENILQVMGFDVQTGLQVCKVGGQVCSFVLGVDPTTASGGEIAIAVAKRGLYGVSCYFLGAAAMFPLETAATAQAFDLACGTSLFNSVVYPFLNSFVLENSLGAYACQLAYQYPTTAGWCIETGIDGAVKVVKGGIYVGNCITDGAVKVINAGIYAGYRTIDGVYYVGDSIKYLANYKDNKLIEATYLALAPLYNGETNTYSPGAVELPDRGDGFIHTANVDAEGKITIESISNELVNKTPEPSESRVLFVEDEVNTLVDEFQPEEEILKVDDFVLIG